MKHLTSLIILFILLFMALKLDKPVKDIYDAGFNKQLIRTSGVPKAEAARGLDTTVFGGVNTTSLKKEQDKRQDAIDGWNSLDNTRFEYSADNVLFANISNTDADVFFALGDKIRIRQLDSAAYKYFYVIDRSATTITVNAGDDYTYTDNAITEIDVSKLATPTGHPVSFDFTTTIYKQSDSSEITGWQTRRGTYNMTGNTIVLSWQLFHNTFPAGESQILCNTPFPASGWTFTSFAETFPGTNPASTVAHMFTEFQSIGAPVSGPGTTVEHMWGTFSANLFRADFNQIIRVQ